MYDSLILSAGLGTRLKPLTDHIPKPLVPYFGTPLLFAALFRVRQFSKGQIFINTHHLHKQIEDFVEKAPATWQESITLNYEPILLGTGGPIAVTHKQSTQEQLLIYNSDCIQSVDLNDLYQFHVQSGCAATMTLLPYCPLGKNPVYAEKGRVIAIGEDKNLDKRKGVTRHTLAGLHFVSREFREAIPEKTFFDVRKTYETFFQNSQGIGAYIYDGPWFDLGEPQDYWSAHEAILTSPTGREFLEQIGVFAYLHHQGLTPKMNFGITKPRFFDLSGTTARFGDLVLNFSKQKSFSSTLTRLMILDNCQSDLLQSNRIVSSLACFNL